MIFLPVMTLRRTSWMKSSALDVFFGYEGCLHFPLQLPRRFENIFFFTAPLKRRIDSV